MKTAIVIPAYNEEKHIAQVVYTAKTNNLPIVVVSDGSKDDTITAAKQAGAITLTHNVNLGKGAALKTGCDYAVQEGFTHLIVLDADGQHDPREVPHFLKALQEYDVVFSYRQGKEKMPFVLRFGNGFINKVLSILYGVSIKDSQNGFRAFSADAYQKIRWQATDYFMETEMIFNIKKHKLTYTQIPIKTIYADNYKGTTVVDGVKIVLKMVLRRLFS